MIKVYQPLLFVKSFILESNQEVSDNIPNYKGDIKSLLYYIQKCSFTKAYDYKYFLIILVLIDVLQSIYLEEIEETEDDEEKTEETEDDEEKTEEKTDSPEQSVT